MLLGLREEDRLGRAVHFPFSSLQGIAGGASLARIKANAAETGLFVLVRNDRDFEAVLGRKSIDQVPVHTSVTDPWHFSISPAAAVLLPNETKNHEINFCMALVQILKKLQHLLVVMLLPVTFSATQLLFNA